jgi:hypothetical protein
VPVIEGGLVHGKEPVRLALSGALKPGFLRDEWCVEIHPRESLPLTFWDSFEWGLWFGGHTLHSYGKTYRLCTRGDGWLGSVVAEEKAAGTRHFWGEFQDARMRNLLQGMLGLRGLAPVARGTVCRRKWDLRNAMGKVVCRLECATVTGAEKGKELLHSCLVIPLLGYEADAARVVDYLTGIGAVTAETGPLEVLLEEAGASRAPIPCAPVSA